MSDKSNVKWATLLKYMAEQSPVHLSGGWCNYRVL
jgi:hypothetical protein